MATAWDRIVSPGSRSSTLGSGAYFGVGRVHSNFGVPEDYQTFRPPNLMERQRLNEITQRQLHSKNLQSAAIAATASLNWLKYANGHLGIDVEEKDKPLHHCSTSGLYDPVVGHNLSIVFGSSNACLGRPAQARDITLPGWLNL
ncbi:hypothetical protein C8Q74DRAFT_1436686 [Fomes fomentarius]|nr:hypothetical protein C8Q74DRAFT_1436686 [Fomes fomentarius]